MEITIPVQVTETEDCVQWHWRNPELPLNLYACIGYFFLFFQLFPGVRVVLKIFLEEGIERDPLIFFGTFGLLVLSLEWLLLRKILQIFGREELEIGREGVRWSNHCLGFRQQRFFPFSDQSTLEWRSRLDAECLGSQLALIYRADPARPPKRFALGWAIHRKAREQLEVHFRAAFERWSPSAAAISADAAGGAPGH